MSKVTLFIMSEKGYSVLEEILNTFDAKIIDFIVVGTDKNVSADFSEQILSLAKKRGIKTVKRNSVYHIKTRYALAISWRWLINYDSSKTQLIILHDSLLPKYRGFAPLVNQLIQKETTIGVTAFIANKEFDKGDIIESKKITISYPIKIQEAILKITTLYKDLVFNILKRIEEENELATSPQNEANATYSLWRDEQDYKINWSQSASEIKRFIDAVGFPYLGASTKLQGRIIRILDVEIEQDLVIINRDYGKILFMKENRPVVVCGQGMLQIKEAVYDDNKKSIFPLQKFRLRFS